MILFSEKCSYCRVAYDLIEKIGLETFEFGLVCLDWRKHILALIEYFQCLPFYWLNATNILSVCHSIG
jgi:hypothetical protein